MVEKLAEMPIVAPRSSQELQRSVELLSRKINEIVRTTRSYADIDHAASHHEGGSAALNLDSIAGTLDAEKLYGFLTVSGITATDAVLGNVAITGFFDIPAGTSVNGFYWAGGSAAPFTALPGSSSLNVNFDADKLDGQHGSYYLNAANLTGTLSDLRLSANVPLLNVGNIFTVSQVIVGGGFVIDRSLITQNADVLRVAGVDKFNRLVSGESRYRWVAGGGVTSSFGEVASGELSVITGSNLRVPALKIDTVQVISSLRVLDNMTFGGTMRGAAIADATGGAVVDVEARAAINAVLAQRRTRGDQAT